MDCDLNRRVLKLSGACLVFLLLVCWSSSALAGVCFLWSEKGLSADCMSGVTEAECMQAEKSNPVFQFHHFLDCDDKASPPECGCREFISVTDGFRKVERLPWELRRCGGTLEDHLRGDSLEDLSPEERRKLIEMEHDPAEIPWRYVVEVTCEPAAEGCVEIRQLWRCGSMAEKMPDPHHLGEFIKPHD